MIISGCGGSSYNPVPRSEYEVRDDRVAVEEVHDMSIVNGESPLENSNFNPIKVNTFEVPFKQHESGVKTIHVKFNDVVGYDAILDTGCSGLTISLQEANSLAKSGTLTYQDQLGTTYSTVATGQIVENGVYNIHELSVQDTKGDFHVIHDIPATVMDNPRAPVLIGNTVLDKFAQSRYIIDLNSETIRFE